MRRAYSTHRIAMNARAFSAKNPPVCGRADADRHSGTRLSRPSSSSPIRSRVVVVVAENSYLIFTRRVRSRRDSFGSS